jgi:hypothetical protein
MDSFSGFLEVANVNRRPLHIQEAPLLASLLSLGGIGFITCRISWAYSIKTVLSTQDGIFHYLQGS